MKCVKVSVYHDHDNSNKVSAIKLWRTITGAGLKESKDFIDTIFMGGFYARKSVVLNMAQYGEMMLLSAEDQAHSGLLFLDVERYNHDVVTDFSKIT